MTDTLLIRLRRRAGEDAGVALITVILLVLVAAALGTAVAVAGVSGLKNANRDRAGAGAQGISDTGVAEAIGYIRSHSIGSLTCDESLSGSVSGNCSTAGWTDPTSPEVVSGGTASAGGSCAPSTDCYEVWIGTLQTYQPPKGQPGASGSAPAQPAIFRIHSVGFSGLGPGARSVDVDVTATPDSFPIGVFGNTVTEHSAASEVDTESIFTSGNITVKCSLSGLDPQYNIPAAIHAAGTITYQGSGSCPPGNSVGDPTTSCLTTSSGVPVDPYDQDSNGINYATSSPCYNYDQTDPNFSSVATTITPYSTGSYFDSSDLIKYGYQPDGLSPDEYSKLKDLAKQEGTYDNEANLATVLANLVAQGVTNPVVYDDNGTAPSLSDFPAQFFRSASTSGVEGADGCTAYSLTIVVRNGSMKWPSMPSADKGLSVVASIFVPDPNTSFEEDGDVSIIGTLFAYTVNLEGNTSPALSLDPCFVDNPPSGVLNLQLINYHGVDNGNIQ